MRSTPISILLLESGGPPLEFRWHILNNRFIIRNVSSVLSAELYAILRAVHYSSRMESKVLVLSNSWRALSCVRDYLAVSVKNYLVLKIAHMLAGLRDLGRVVEFMRVPGHVSIAGNEVVDQVARVPRGLPYYIRYGLPFCDLHDPVGRDFEAWAGLL